MKLARNWKVIATRSRCFWLCVVASALSGFELAISLYPDFFPVKPGIFLILSFLVTVGATYARLAAQKSLVSETRNDV